MRHPSILVRRDAILLLVDTQERLAAVMAERERVVGQARKMILAAQTMGVPVIVAEQYPQGLGPTVPELRAALDAKATCFAKTAFSCCSDEQLARALAAQPDRHSVLLVGMEAHVCVYQTALDLLTRGYTVHVAVDAITSRRPDDKDMAVQSMRRCGVVVTTVESAIFQLLERCDIPEFREVLKLVK